MCPDLLDILRSGRLHTSMATAAIPATACIAMGGEPGSVALVVFGAVMHHGWGFSLNEIMDLRIDRGNPELADKPLVSGRVSVVQAHAISFTFLLLSLVSFILAGILFSNHFFLPLVFILLATVSGSIYDIFGKKFPLSDIFMGSWMFFLVLAGGFSSGGTPNPTVAVVAVPVMGGLQILFNNSVEGGLKDVANDRSSGTRTLAVKLGARFEDGTLRPGKGIIIWGLSLRIIYVLSGAIASVLIADEAGWEEWIIITSTIVGISVFLHSLNYLRKELLIERKALLKVFALHEVLSFLFLIVVMMPAIGWLASIFLFTVPFIFYLIMNRIMFGTGLAPKV